MPISYEKIVPFFLKPVLHFVKNKFLERHKYDLKFKEKHRDSFLEASKELYKIWGSVTPEKRTSDDDLEDFLTSVAISLPILKEELRGFLEEYHPILPEDICALLVGSQSLCIDVSLEINEAGFIPSEAIKKTEKAWKNIEKAYTKLKELITIP